MRRFHWNRGRYLSALVCRISPSRYVCLDAIRRLPWWRWPLVQAGRYRWRSGSADTGVRVGPFELVVNDYGVPVRDASWPREWR